jgi:hypothetical protein
MFALAAEPENSLDTAAAAVAAVTAPAQSTISPGTQGKRNLQTSHTEHPTTSKENDSIHSRTFPYPPISEVMLYLLFFNEDPGS